MTALERALASIAARDGGAFRPRRFAAADAGERDALAQLIDSGAVLFLHDELEAQLAELVEIRAPDRKLDRDESARAIAEHLGGRPPAWYGEWVHYPWSGRLVHVLPRDEYVRVRTSRNQNKITVAEQQRLGELTVGVAGLSVGQATAVTLALEGVGGRFRLADFDAINLSNLNRLRAGAHAIGVNKAVVTAREIFEINPYAEIELFPTGVHEANLDEFVGGLDLLFEECDDLKMKVRLREAARRHRVPVLMETSDRGLFDLERFDLEPERPIFHGLAGELRAADLDGLTTFEKVPVVLKIIGETTMSRRMAASLVDIEATIKSWPQLASAVALGGAINTDAARRVALGELRASGRYFVDLAELIADGGAAPPAAPSLAPTPAAAPPSTRPRPLPLVRSAALGEATLHAIVEHGTLAPSGGNSQPWRFRARGEAIDCLLDRERATTFLDFAASASHLAIGAAVENMRLAAGALGLRAEVEPFPGGDVVCRLHLGAAGADADPLVEQIDARATNRRIAARARLSERERTALHAAAAPARLQLLEAPDALDALGAVLGRGDRVRFLSRQMHGEMMAELRWSADEAARTGDGLDVATLELTPTDLAGLRLVSRWPIMETLGEIGGGAGLTKATRKAIDGAAAVGLLVVDGTGAESYLRGGGLLQRVWLTATALDLAVQPMTALLYLFARLERGAAAGLSPLERTELADLRVRFARLFQVGDGAELMLFRVGRAAPPTTRSLRRKLDDVLEFG